MELGDCYFLEAIDEMARNNTYANLTMNFVL